MTKLLNIDANAKTVKGQKKGYMTAVMYLAPYKASGVNVCPLAELAGCWKTCLNTAGRGGMSKGGATFSANGITLPDNAIQRARIWRTQLWVNHRERFWAMLVKELDAFIAKAKREGLTPVVRLNGTSDIEWERRLYVGPRKFLGKNIFSAYPDLQFYDYTKIAARFSRKQQLPNNYHLTLSYSEANDAYAEQCWKLNFTHKVNLAIVVKDKVLKEKWLNRPMVEDFDEHDLRFLDPPGCIGVLKAKGSARHETNGFVIGG